MTIKHNMLGSNNREVLIDFIKELQSGLTQGIPVQLGLLSEFADTASYEKIDYLHDFQFSAASWEEAERPFFQILPIDTSVPVPVDTPIVDGMGNQPDETLIEQLKTNANLYAQLEIINLAE